MWRHKARKVVLLWPQPPQEAPLILNDTHDNETDLAEVEFEEVPPNMSSENWRKELKVLQSLDLTLKQLRNWKDAGDPEKPDAITEGFETDGKMRNSDQVSLLQHEKDMRKLWRYVYKTTSYLETADKIYGQTLTTLDYKDKRPETLEKKLKPAPDAQLDFTVDRPVRLNPYPDYNSDEWKEEGFAPYVACQGAFGEKVEDLLVFKGRPHEFPEPKMGSYSLLGMDPNICWERDTRLGRVGLQQPMRKVGNEVQKLEWDDVNWGEIQKRCVEKNADRFEMRRSSENQFQSHYPELAKIEDPAPATEDKDSDKEELDESDASLKAREQAPPRQGPVSDEEDEVDPSKYKKEKRTAVLLRSYTGKTYTPNDMQTIRAMMNELTIRSGGEYEVFLLVHVKDQNLQPFASDEKYQEVLKAFIPREFHGITVLWNDKQVWEIYDKMTDNDEKSVHSAQWLSVQKFSHDHPQFDFIWNWEMDFRFTGHHYDLLDNLHKFAAKQPRKGAWERAERWYIPKFHGDYDTTFRKSIEERYGNETVWGPVERPFIKPVGPKPPVASPGEDDYEWGVGEEADYISVSPIFNPIDSNWIIRDGVWGYEDSKYRSRDLPRRTTIVTHSRLSKRLLAIMHIENKRGNHVASEMTPQTVSLLHGLKAVFAPQPVFMDRDWSPEFVNDWFNPGPKGESGGFGSPMGWGRERRYIGNTWYYRSIPPNRLYNNWMGWVDTEMGGHEWEKSHGRPCLPSIMLHPVKDTEPTKEGHKTEFGLHFG
ncbi:hypothetical protein ESCO_006146 [Escovopsis weberi]|uniref:Major facilitator superfamily transporter n=1 Tax=Escovopsis weberi TaxID=150374 RepID=A0A0M9VUP3_ESCWE|nr:hypothetical protein ESCO_006146 [Escovopsis weberi]